MPEDLNNLYTIAFYNLENLFDTVNDPNFNDSCFTPDGRLRWTQKRYEQKIKKLSTVIAQIGEDKSKKPPSLVGIAEVENYKVIDDLISAEHLEGIDYGIVHHDGHDERGIEVGLLYKKDDFELLHSTSHELLIFEEDGSRDYTRDILHVKGNLKGHTVHVIVNHWPSRRSGTQETEYKRIEAAQKVHKIIDNIKTEDPDPKILIMGDFNDSPNNPSVKHHLVTEKFYNPFESHHDKGRGTSTHEKEWHLFDQIVFSKNFFEDSSSLMYENAYIFNEHFLRSWKGKRKGSPFRTYIGKWYQGGFSDHYPVYIHLIKSY